MGKDISILTIAGIIGGFFGFIDFIWRLIDSLIKRTTLKDNTYNETLNPSQIFIGSSDSSETPYISFEITNKGKHPIKLDKLGFILKDKRKNPIWIDNKNVVIIDTVVGNFEKLPQIIEFPKTKKLSIKLTDYAFEEGLIRYVIRDSLGKVHKIKTSKKWVKQYQESWEKLKKM